MLSKLLIFIFAFTVMMICIYLTMSVIANGNGSFKNTIVSLFSSLISLSCFSIIGIVAGCWTFIEFIKILLVLVGVIVSIFSIVLFTVIACYIAIFLEERLIDTTPQKDIKPEKNEE